MAPVDRRLLQSARSARPHLAMAALLGALAAALIVAQAVLLARAIDSVAMHGAGVAAITGTVVALAAVLAARALVAAGFELSGRVGAIRVMSELRGRLVRHLLIARPGGRPADQRTGDLATAAVQGVDALEAYLAGYLPQLALATVVPVAVLAWVAPLSIAAAAILAVTIPLLVVFMILVGKGTQVQTRRRWRALTLLSAHFLDVVQGLPTLVLHRRERAQAATLEAVGERYRRETLATLRVAFLSALVLELCAMIGTAMVAATVGVALAGGHMSLTAGLTILLLAPELYAPLRAVGQQFHASADGMAAAERIFAAIDEPPAVSSPERTRPTPDPGAGGLRFEGVSFAYPHRAGLVLDELDLELRPGEMTAIVGPSGSGKSTLATLALRLADPTAGRVLCDGVDLRDVDPDDWRRQVAWVPQHTRLFRGTIADNIRLADPSAGEAAVREAARKAGALGFVDALPLRFDEPIGEGGRRLSAGQSRRLALARAFLRDAPLLVLDEPTAHLDDVTAAEVGDAIERLARGRTTLLIVHDPQLAARADSVVSLASAEAVA